MTDITADEAAAQRALLAQEVKRHVSPATINRHTKRRQLPKREVSDVAERLMARLDKNARRAAAARKAGLLP